MEFQSYNAELGVSNLLFSQCFRNIRIEHTENDGSKRQQLVQCMLGQRSRILKGLENPDKRGNMRLPMIIINRTGYSRNGERLNNLHNEVKYELGPASRKYQLMTPVPVDIDYEVSIVSKYPSDIDKIASNFMVFFNSDIYVSCEHPKYEGLKMNNQIVMQDSVSEDHPDELDSSQDDLTIATFQFVFKTYLFAGTAKAKLVPQSVISSQISTVLSNVIVEIAPDKIDDFQQQHPDQAVSAYVQKQVQVEVTSIVSSDISVQAYDGVPIVHKIDFGLYAVPGQHDIESYIQSVDNGDFGPHIHEDVSGYISSKAYIKPFPTALSDPYAYDLSNYNYPLSTCELCTMSQPLKTTGDVYGIVDQNCSLEPYVDKIYWTINADSVYSFPNNVIWNRG